MTEDAATADRPSIERQAARVHVTAWRSGVAETREDRLAGEEPMAIRACGPGQDPIDIAVTMRTPGHEAELAAGFLLTEGLIDGREDIVSIQVADPGTHARPDDDVMVHLARPLDPEGIATRNFVATASCGICGKASLDQVEVRCAPIPDGPVVTPEVLLALPERLREGQAVFGATGGLHASGLFTPDGTLVALREDIGRHNALDKLVGNRLLAGDLPLNDRVLLGLGPGQLRARPEGGRRRHPAARRHLRPERSRRGGRGAAGRDPGGLPARRRLQRLCAAGAGRDRAGVGREERSPLPDLSPVVPAGTPARRATQGANSPPHRRKQATSPAAPAPRGTPRIARAGGSRRRPRCPAPG